MKYLPLIWSGIWRKPGRTTLILLQVALAFALFGVLTGHEDGRGSGHCRMLAPTCSSSLPPPLAARLCPVPTSSDSSTIPGVKTVAFADGLLGTYQKPTQPVYVLALETSDVWLTLVPEIFKVAAQGSRGPAEDPNRRADQRGYRQEIRLAHRGPDPAHLDHSAEQRLGNLGLRHRGHVHGSRDQPGRLHRGELRLPG